VALDGVVLAVAGAGNGGGVAVGYLERYRDLGDRYVVGPGGKEPAEREVTDAARAAARSIGVVRRMVCVCFL
jgi:hypothetical protein